MSAKDARRQLIAGNWKLQNTLAQSSALTQAVIEGTVKTTAEVVVAPVFTALTTVREALAGSHVALSAQDVYWQDKGAFTGEVSAPLLKDVGCTYCIIGHSERRQFFGETDETVRKKTRALISHGLAPILCIGESLEQREQGATIGVVIGQLAAGIAGISDAELHKLVVAYEPVWAIGTGKTATPGDAQLVHAAIRGYLTHERGEAFAQGVRLLYGGSVKADNAKELLAQTDIDGALVGGASLVADQFVAIVAAAR
ncbi:MAG: Triosephosphate isomerase [Myxococcaceae bacterium]|nr:Triosephosphate isomerase [Myxococcaceae bacterium]